MNSGKTQSKPKSQGPRPEVAAARRGGLREAAKLKGHYVGSQQTSGWVKHDLESLTQHSLAIIVGTPILASSNLAGDGDRIVTEYKIKVDQLLKGTLKEGALINIVVPGGKVAFEDGTSAEIVTPDLGPIKIKNRYVFFLRPSDEGATVLSLTGGGQGLFELTAGDGRVKPRGDRVDVVQKHENQQAEEFLEEIRTAVKKHPEHQSVAN